MVKIVEQLIHIDPVFMDNLYRGKFDRINSLLDIKIDDCHDKRSLLEEYKKIIFDPIDAVFLDFYNSTITNFNSEYIKLLSKNEGECRNFSSYMKTLVTMGHKIIWNLGDLVANKTIFMSIVESMIHIDSTLMYNLVRGKYDKTGDIANLLNTHLSPDKTDLLEQYTDILNTEEKLSQFYNNPIKYFKSDYIDKSRTIKNSRDFVLHMEHFINYTHDIVSYDKSKEKKNRWLDRAKSLINIDSTFMLNLLNGLYNKTGEISRLISPNQS